MDGKGDGDPLDRENRVQARRNRIDMRNASKDDESKKKKKENTDAKKMSRGRQQIVDSLNQLDRRKVRINLV